jgi:hypothetical protein
LTLPLSWSPLPSSSSRFIEISSWAPDHAHQKSFQESVPHP